ncbi:CreA [Shewanella denitrificans OS217]|jgi:CreA protein|uniref:CreA n=1 Tax=Shewanella denitrificans (strain OS217 / ATCC BAA-1090 / DSM 15013) TaxID=318161 RepID=Q12ME6_SHEDO|nr:CreA family protein [Shewanella denitrificans]ABE55380.1 CreA [Shewanella denitrificans OS217]
MKQQFLPLALGLGITVIGLTACSDDVGKVSLGLFTTKDVLIDAKHDPKIPGVTCHISRIQANLDFADPSDMSISCRQTGPITAAQLENINLDKDGEVVFKESLSILFKSLKVRRIFDKQNQTLLYLSYSTKETNGSHKHALSTVPLYGTEAFNPNPVTLKD